MQTRQRGGDMGLEYGFFTKLIMQRYKILQD
jgi:hypothetical protein